MKKSLRLLLPLLLAATILLTACAGSTAPVTDTPVNPDAGTGVETPATPKPLETIRFNAEISSLRAAVPILAKELGFFEEEGIDAVFETAAGASGLAAIIADKSDIQVTGVYQTLASIAKDDDVIIIGGTAAEGSSAIAKPENVERLKDLKNWKGISVATTPMNNADFVTRAAVLAAGVDPSTEITYKEYDSTDLVVQAIFKGDADVAIIVNDSLKQLVEPLGLEVVFPVADIAPMYVCCRHTARKSDVLANREKYVNIYIAELRAYKIYKDDHDQTVAILHEAAKQDEDYIINYLYAEGSSSPLTLDPSLNKIKNLYGLLQEWDKIEDTNADVTEGIDITIYKDALDEIIRRYPDEPLYKQLLEEYQANNSDAL
ncbi:MAG: ABC transporter substrate-binding protein [Oscillospiraceae bacterium]|jgi:NitT/TauT family transport system substrate-binding protein|nr:ABC transporter substrate-binding protein [Oscillospiraceae bacterium]